MNFITFADSSKTRFSTHFLTIFTYFSLVIIDLDITNLTEITEHIFNHLILIIIILFNDTNLTYPTLTDLLWP